MARFGLGDRAKKSAKCPFHQDRHNSFSVWRSNGSWRWKCHAGCGAGDEINFVEKREELSQTAATRRYLEMAGSNGGTPASTSTFLWQKYVAAFTDQHAERLAQCRGYELEFCQWLKKNGLVGLVRGCFAFPVHDHRDNVVAAHVEKKSGGNWFYEPTGAKTRPLIIGELLPGEPVHVFESQWDAFAFMDASGQRSGVIITRGSSNGGFVAGLIPSGSTVYAWTQNDKAGEDWQAAICANTCALVKRPRIPAPHKDANDWTRAGATTDLLSAMLDAETIKEPLSPEKLFNDIKRFLLRYIVLSQPEHADVLALWTMHTWVADQADYTPYIYLHSPVMRCGKTQVQKVVEPLVRNPLRTCNVSEAALYREIEESRPTLLWDEIDSIFGSRKTSEANENKRALLNAGHERGMRAIRMDRRRGGFQKVSYDPFCPKILAGIGRVPDTIVDRSIPILIHRRLKTQPCQKYRRRDRDSAKSLHDALEAWSKDNELLKTLRTSQPQMPEYMTDRQEDIWEPLLAIADSIGGVVPELARKAARAICGNDDELGYSVTQLAAIKEVVGDHNQIASADLIDVLWKADALPSRFNGWRRTEP